MYEVCSGFRESASSGRCDSVQALIGVHFGIAISKHSTNVNTLFQ